MKKLRLLWIIVRRSGAGKVIASFLLTVLVCGFVVESAEPNIKTYGDALWFLWAVSTTVGLGDYTGVTLIGRMAAVICSIYGIITAAIFTGVIVDYFNESRQHQRDEALSEFLDKLENLPSLSKQELEELSKSVKRMRTQGGNH